MGGIRRLAHVCGDRPAPRNLPRQIACARRMPDIDRITSPFPHFITLPAIGPADEYYDRAPSIH